MKEVACISRRDAINDPQPRPGQAALCPGCIHHLPKLLAIGHVNPCKAVAGGKKDQRPKLVRYVGGREECDKRQAN